MNLTRDKVMLQWYCAQRIKLDWNHCKVKVNKFWCYSLVRFFFFPFSHDTYTFIFLVTSFFCIFSLIPLLIQVLMSQRLFLASSVGINLTVPNFRVCFLLQLILHQKLSFQNWSTQSCTSTNCFPVEFPSLICINEA